MTESPAAALQGKWGPGAVDPLAHPSGRFLSQELGDLQGSRFPSTAVPVHPSIHCRSSIQHPRRQVPSLTSTKDPRSRPQILVSIDFVSGCTRNIGVIFMTAASVYTLCCTGAGFLHSAIGNWKLEQLEFDVGRFLHPSWLPMPQHPYASRLTGVHKQQFHSTKQGTCTLFFVTATYRLRAAMLANSRQWNLPMQRYPATHALVFP